jgi:L-amino acid N-acyltransferase YncA
LFIREANISDLPQILNIYNDVILNTTAVYDYDPHTPEMRAAWFKTKQEQGFPVFVMEDSGRIAGFSSIGPFRAWAAYQYTVENSVYVDSAYRGKGIGKKLMEPLIQAVKDRKLHSIVAGIDASNNESIRLHEGFGFQEVAHFKEVGYKFGRWLDLKFLQLIVHS